MALTWSKASWPSTLGTRNGGGVVARSIGNGKEQPRAAYNRVIMAVGLPRSQIVRIGFWFACNRAFLLRLLTI